MGTAAWTVPTNRRSANAEGAQQLDSLKMMKTRKWKWTRPPPELLVITRRKRSLAAATELLIPHTERRTLPMELLVTRSQRSTRRRRSVSLLTTEGNAEVQTTLSRPTTSTLAVTVSLTTEASGDSGVV